ncbi:MAG: hypothetical protein AAGF73_07190 [Actinomycetota bacterium]
MKLASREHELPIGVAAARSLISAPHGLMQWHAVDATIELQPGGTVRWSHDDG